MSNFITNAELRIEMERLFDKNDKLGKLVSALNWCTENFDLPNRCDKCPLQQSDVLTPECEFMMQELGIKVEK